MLVVRCEGQDLIKWWQCMRLLLYKLQKVVYKDMRAHTEQIAWLYHGYYHFITTNAIVHK